MKFPGRELRSLLARRRARTALTGCAVAAGAVLLTAPVIGGGVNRSPDPASPVIAATVPATTWQVARAGGSTVSTAVKAAGKTGKTKGRVKVVAKPVTIRSRITTEPIVTELDKGSFVGIRCPAGSRAISGGVLSNFINLLTSSSAPNSPVTGKYTPNTWWVSVTNTDIDGNGGALAWRGVVNCLSPVRVAK